MRAITDIPANTAKPMGRTDNFLPGSINAAEDVEDAIAADGDTPPALSAAAEAIGETVGTAVD
jgi:hypothetical protein